MNENINIAVNGIEQKELTPQPPVENWLQSFLDADFVINDSFHACVFSILFHKATESGRAYARDLIVTYLNHSQKPITPKILK